MSSATDIVSYITSAIIAVCYNTLYKSVKLFGPVQKGPYICTFIILKLPSNTSSPK